MKKNIFILLLVTAVVAPVFFGTWGLTESSEARYAEISREMYLSGDYINPTLLGIKHFHKPPVTYYITAAGYAIFGVNEMGARFFLSVSLLLQLFFVYRIALLLYKDRKMSVAAMLLYFSFPIAQIAAKNLTTDCYLTTFIFAGIYFYLSYRQSFKKLWLYLFYASCGLAFLTKGPVGVLPQALFALGYGILLKPKRSFNFHNMLALLFGIAISFSWFILLLYHNPKLLDYFVGHQLVDRVSSNTFERTKPYWYYFAMMPLLGLPAMVIFADYGLKNIRRFRFLNRTNLLLILVLSASFLVFSSSASKLVLYVQPLYLFIAIAAARHLSVIGLNRSRVLSNIVTIFFIILLLAPVAGLFISTPFNFPVAPVLIICLAGIACLIYCRNKTGEEPFLKPAICAASGMAFLVLLLPFMMGANETSINSVKPLEAVIEKNAGSNKTIIVYNQLLPSLAFYTGKKIVTIHNGNNNTNRESQFEDEPYEFKKYYFRLPEDSARLRTLQDTAGYVIVAKQSDSLPVSVSFLLKRNPAIIKEDKWAVYY